MAAIILAIATGVSTTPLTALASRFGGGEEGFVDPNTFRKAPAVISGETSTLLGGQTGQETGK